MPFISGPLFRALAYLLAAAVGIIGVLVLVLPTTATSLSAAWNYPPWMTYGAAALQVMAALMMLFAPTRSMGAIMAAIVLTGAGLTYLWNGDTGIALIAVSLGSVLILVAARAAQAHTDAQLVLGAGERPQD